MKRLHKILSVGLSLALCAALVAPALAHTVTIEGGDGPKTVDTVQQGVEMIAESARRAGTITMDKDEEVTGRGVTIHGCNVTLDLNGWTLANNEQSGHAITVDRGDLTLQDSSEGKSGKVEAAGDFGIGVDVRGGTLTMEGGTVSSGYMGVNVSFGGTLTMEGGAVEADGHRAKGVNVSFGSTFNMKGGAVKADGDGAKGVNVSFDGTFNMKGGEVKGTGPMSWGVDVCFNNSQFIMTDGVVTGDSWGVDVSSDFAKFTMNGGTVGSTAEGGVAVEANDGSAQAVLNKGTIYGEVLGNVTIDEDNVTIKPAPYVKPDEPERPDQPDVVIDDPDVPLAGPVSLQELLEELHRRAGASGEVLAWAADNGLADADADGTELVTVGALRAILSRYAEVFGTNAVAVPDLVTLTGEDEDLVLNCGEVLAEFFGEE